MPEGAKEPLLRMHLESHDYPCEQCGYNLRNIQEPFCPECGTVIPRPTTDDLNQSLIGTRPDHRLWCIHCRYPVHNFEGDHCPACGKSLVMQATTEPDRRILGVPARTFLQVLLLMLPLANAVVRFFDATARQNASGRLHAVNGFLTALLGIVLALAWWRYAPRLGPLHRRIGNVVAWFIVAACLYLSLKLG
jgi:hypothetical protein